MQSITGSIALCDTGYQCTVPIPTTVSYTHLSTHLSYLEMVIATVSLLCRESSQVIPVRIDFSVSYTHLDVYKRQVLNIATKYKCIFEK